jgi:uncharacterized protein (TIGR04141 family)
MSDLKKISLFKIKPNTPFENFLKDKLSTYDHVKNEENGFEGYIRYTKGEAARKDETQIPWLNFLNSAFEETKYTYESYNRYPRAILALKIKVGEQDFFYVATFGQHGDSFLNKDYVVRDFGIKIAMNICDLEKLRRLQTTKHESISQHTERQVSIGTNLSIFNMNNEVEFLKAISGSVKADFKDIIDSFKGKDNITLKFTKENSC